MTCPKNIGASLKSVGNIAHSLIAAGTGDNTTKTSAAIDLLGYRSAVVALAWAAITVTDTKKLNIRIQREQSADNSSWDAAETIYAATDVFTAAGATVAGTGLIEIDQDDVGAIKRYVRYSVLADLTHTSVDLAAYGLVVTLGGGDVVPAL